MRKFIALFYCFTALGILCAQDSTTTDLSDAKASSIGRDRFIFDLHWDGWLGAPDSLKVGAFSRGVGVHFFYDIPLTKNDSANKVQFSFAPGIGYSCSNYTNKAQFFADTAGLITIAPFDASVDPKRNKLVLNYVEVPLEFRFRTKENDRHNRFKIALGFKGAYMFSSHITYVGPESASNLTEEVKYKTYRIKSLNTIQYGPTFRFGYSNVNLEAYYGLNTIFETDRGPVGSPLIIGVSFNPF